MKEQVQVFESGSPADLMEQVNAWLDALSKNAAVIDRKMSQSTNDRGLHRITIAIFYRTATC
jgi:hypothetical protein